MMVPREHNRVRLKQEVDAAVEKLKSVRWTCRWKEGECLRSDKQR